MEKPDPTGSAPSPQADLRAAYAQARREFTHEDLQRYLVEEEGVPLIQIIEELEEIERQAQRKRA